MIVINLSLVHCSRVACRPTHRRPTELQSAASIKTIFFSRLSTNTQHFCAHKLTVLQRFIRDVTGETLWLLDRAHFHADLILMCIYERANERRAKLPRWSYRRRHGERKKESFSSFLKFYTQVSCDTPSSSSSSSHLAIPHGHKPITINNIITIRPLYAHF